MSCYNDYFVLVSESDWLIFHYKLVSFKYSRKHILFGCSAGFSVGLILILNWRIVIKLPVWQCCSSLAALNCWVLSLEVERISKQQSFIDNQSLREHSVLFYLILFGLRSTLFMFWKDLKKLSYKKFCPIRMSVSEVLGLCFGMNKFRLSSILKLFHLSLRSYGR